MKFKVVLCYPSGYRYRKEIECESEQEANKIALEMACEKDKHFVLPHHPELIGRIVKVESVTEIKPLTVLDAIKTGAIDIKGLSEMFYGSDQSCPPDVESCPFKETCIQCWEDYLNSPYTKEDGT